MSILCVLCIVAIPILLIIFLIRWIMKKKKKRIGLSTLFCFIGIIITALIGSQANLYSMSPEERATYYEKLEQEKEQREAEKAAEEKKKDNSYKETAESKENETKTTSSKESVKIKKEISKKPVESKTESDAETEITPTITFTDKEMMIMQFEELGFANAEAVEMQKILKNVGIEKISNITGPLGSGVNGEEMYVCHFYDFNPNTDCIKVSFVTAKKKIQRISICYSPYGKLGEYSATHKYKKLKLLDGIQEDTHSDSVTLYYKKLKNMAVDENSVGYRAIYDYKTHSVSKYK